MKPEFLRNARHPCRVQHLAVLGRRLCLIVFFTACTAPTRPLAGPQLALSGFSSRETAGEEPMFDVAAASAEMLPGSSTMVIRNVQFTLFRDGRKYGHVVSDTGIFYPERKNVELYGGVTYDGYDDNFHVRAERMEWDSASSVLRCDTGVQGWFKSFTFAARRLDLSRTRSVMHLQHATFTGPG